MCWQPLVARVLLLQLPRSVLPVAVDSLLAAELSGVLRAAGLLSLVADALFRPSASLRRSLLSLHSLLSGVR